MAVINIGSTIENRDTAILAGYTVIEKAGPANDSGVIDSVQLWFATNAAGVYVGIFRLVSGTTYHCYAAAAIPGTVTAGSEQVFAVSLTCATGDLIGVYSGNGTLEQSLSGGSGNVYYNGNSCVVGDERSYTAQAGRAMSAHATGATDPMPAIVEGDLATKMIAAGLFRPPRRQMPRILIRRHR